MIIQCSLEGCEELFEDFRGKRYCSPEHQKKNKTKKRFDKVCARVECSIEFKGEKNSKYCSHSCAAKVNNYGVRRHGDPKNCLNCGKTVSVRQDYCLASCRKEHRTALWLAGEIDGAGKYQTLSFVRDYILDRAAWRCEGVDSRTGERCVEDRRTSTGRSILDLDHIDGNWQNNRPENLRMLCPNCHRLTDTWGSGNMGNGRTWKKSYNQFSPKT